MTEQSSILARILAKKKAEVALLKTSGLAKDFARKARDAEPPRDFIAALRGSPKIPIIAEIKKASPSAGVLDSELAVAVRAADYEAGGAAALSVLTDGPFFHGSLDDLTEARRAVKIPVLRKDFIIDPLQLHQSRAAGADAVLLIVAALDQPMLFGLFAEARDMGLAALVEVHDEAELERASLLNPPLLGINNRNLSTMTVSLDTCLALRPLAPKGCLVVGESGVNGPEDVKRLRAGGIDAFLVGTALMKAKDPRAALAAMCRAED